MHYEPKTITFDSFPNDPNFAQIEGKLFMSDNIFDPHKPRVQIMNTPVRLGMSVVVTCVSGEMDIEINLKLYKLKANNVATLMTGSLMQIKGITEDFTSFMIAVAPDFQEYSRDIRAGLTVTRLNRYLPISPMPEENMRDAIAIYGMLKNKLLSPNFGYKEQVAIRYLDILKYNGFQAIDQFDKANPHVYTYSRRDEIFENFMQEVNRFFRTERKIPFYAERLGVSPKYLSTVIKQVSGEFASDIINKIITIEIKALLLNQNFSMKEICAQLNFSSQTVFTKFFKQQTGMTPKQFRNK